MLVGSLGHPGNVLKNTFWDRRKGAAAYGVAFGVVAVGACQPELEIHLLYMANRRLSWENSIFRRGEVRGVEGDLMLLEGRNYRMWHNILSLIGRLQRDLGLK